MTSNQQTGEHPNSEVRDKLKQELGEKTRQAADALDDVEAATAAQADELKRRGREHLSGYVRDMANGIGDLSENLRHKSVDELIRDASELARRNTGLFLLGSVAVGFGLSRIVKTVPDASEAQASARGADGSNYSYPAGESQSASFESDSEHAPQPYETH